MAIKDKKIPSPESIKTTTQSFTKEELEEVKNLKNNLNILISQMGSLYVNKIKLEENEVMLKNQLKDLEKKEADLALKLSKKYGKGSIDIETGTFTPIS